MKLDNQYNPTFKAMVYPDSNYKQYTFNRTKLDSIKYKLARCRWWGRSKINAREKISIYNKSNVADRSLYKQRKHEHLQVAYIT